MQARGTAVKRPTHHPATCPLYGKKTSSLCANAIEISSTDPGMMQSTRWLMTEPLAQLPLQQMHCWRQVITACSPSSRRGILCWTPSLSRDPLKLLVNSGCPLSSRQVNRLKSSQGGKEMHARVDTACFAVFTSLCGSGCVYSATKLNAAAYSSPPPTRVDHLARLERRVVMVRSMVWLLAAWAGLHDVTR
jgi:hypothetical protein